MFCEQSVLALLQRFESQRLSRCLSPTPSTPDWSSPPERAASGCAAAQLQLEELLHIFRWLSGDLRSLLGAASVCRAWAAAAAAEPSLWRAALTLSTSLAARLSDERLASLLRRADGRLDSLSLPQAARLTDASLPLLATAAAPLQLIELGGCTGLTLSGLASAFCRLPAIPTARRLSVRGARAAGRDAPAALAALRALAQLDVDGQDGGAWACGRAGCGALLASADRRAARACLACSQRFCPLCAAEAEAEAGAAFLPCSGCLSALCPACQASPPTTALLAPCPVCDSPFCGPCAAAASVACSTTGWQRRLSCRGRLCASCARACSVCAAPFCDVCEDVYGLLQTEGDAATRVCIGCSTAR